MRVYREKIEARSEGISLYTFSRISPRKINILKRTKLGPVDLNKFNDINFKKVLLDLTNILKSATKMSKKWNKKKKCSKFFYIEICYRVL